MRWSKGPGSFDSNCEDAHPIPHARLCLTGLRRLTVHHWGGFDPQQFDGLAGVVAAQTPLDGYAYSLTLTLPPLAVLWLKPG